MRAFAANAKKISTEFIEMNEDDGIQSILSEYYKQLSTWVEAKKSKFKAQKFLKILNRLKHSKEFG